MQHVDAEGELRADSQVLGAAATCTCISLSAAVIRLIIVVFTVLLSSLDALVFCTHRYTAQQVAIVMLVTTAAPIIPSYSPDGAYVHYNLTHGSLGSQESTQTAAGSVQPFAALHNRVTDTQTTQRATSVAIARIEYCSQFWPC